jgi:hypothetical protein
MTELDQEPSMEELSKAIDMLATRKSPGADRNARSYHEWQGSPLELLLKLLIKCWEEGVVP